MPTVFTDLHRPARSGASVTVAARAPRTTRSPARPRDSPLLLVACLSLLAALVRLPSFARPFWSPDEGYLSTQAAMLRDGGRLYVDVVDRKPPLLPWLYEACLALAGDHALFLVRVLAVGALSLTAVYTARLAGRLLGPWAALPAGVLTVAASAALPAPDAMAATFEIFMLPATAAAVYYGVKGRWLTAGLAVAVAALTKQVGLAVLLPLAFMALTGAGRRRGAVRLAVGTALPLLGCAALLGWRPFAFWVLFSSGSYATSPPGWGEVLGHATGNLGHLMTAFAGCAALVLLPRANRGTPPRPSQVRATAPAPATSPAPAPAADRVLVVWLVASAAGVSVGWHYYGHYFLQLVPPLALLALRGVDRFGRTVRTGRPRASVLVTLSALMVAAGWTTAAFRAEEPDMAKSLAVARVVRDLTEPGQPVFAWSMHPEVYWQAERPPASRYLTAGLLTNYSGGGDPHTVGRTHAVPGTWPVLLRELAATPPCAVVDDSAGTPYDLTHYPELHRLLTDGYRLETTVDGARVYRRHNATDNGCGPATS
ncbi:ArnT family glycosyltransferase [Streptomyces sp. CWNU-52B]|uniref:ArnT family glycosyltransferase n=1 Tax=unclassified Streptomyces TaxID=2593676 RepID=UPI0039BF80C5